jgi:hypothetical protein
MIHIVFNEADIKVLQQAIELDETLQGEIIQIKDDFAVGPLENIYETEGFQVRRDWWKELLENSPYQDQLDLVNDKLTVHHLQEKLTENSELEIWIWMAQNAHDVCGYYWFMSQFKSFAGRIQVLYMNNLPFINEKGQLFYPNWLHEIQPKEFLKAKKLSRHITLSEFEIDPDEWKKTCSENDMVRFLEGGKKIVGKDVSFFDKEILMNISSDYTKLIKVLQNCSNKMKVKTGDVFIVGRIKYFIENNMLEMQGDWAKGWKEISIKLLSQKEASENLS